MKRLCIALVLVVLAGCSHKQSFTARVRTRDKTGFFNTYPSKTIEDLGDQICADLRVKALPLVMAKIPDGIPPYSWGVLMGSAIKGRCGS